MRTHKTRSYRQQKLRTRLQRHSATAVQMHACTRLHRNAYFDTFVRLNFRFNLHEFSKEFAVLSPSHNVYCPIISHRTSAILPKGCRLQQHGALGVLDTHSACFRIRCHFCSEFVFGFPVVAVDFGSVRLLHYLAWVQCVGLGSVGYLADYLC